jgi:hypothetical protein
MLRILEQKYYTQTRGITATDLKACIGEKVKIETTLYSEIVSVTNADNRVLFHPSIHDIGITAYSSDVIYFDDTDFVSLLSVGNVIQAVDETDPLSIINGTFEVKEILNANSVRFYGLASFPEGIYYIGGDGNKGYVSNITTFKYFEISQAVSISGNASPTTKQVQTSSIISSNDLSLISESNLTNLNGKEWQSGELKLIGEGDGYGSQKIVKLINEFIVTPLFISTELDDLLLGIKPDFWKKPENVKYKSEIVFAKTKALATDSNKIAFESIGEFGWFNTRYDNASANYYRETLVLTKVSDSSSVNALEFANEVNVLATIKKVSGSLLNNASTKIVVGFNYLPQSEVFYRNNGKTLTENFLYDSIVIDMLNGEVNGVSFGTDNQIIKVAEATFVNSTTFTVRIRVKFGDDIIPILRQDSEAWYNLWLICEDTSIVSPLCDKSSILLQTNKVHEDLVDINLFNNNTLFIEHPYSSTFFGKETLEMFPVDDVISNSLLQLDYTGKETEGIKIVSVEPSIVLKHATEADIILERAYINCENFDLVGTLPAIQDIDYTQDREFKLPVGDLRKTIVFARDYANDSGAIKAWALSYPFMNRWEYWLKLEGLTSIPTSIFSSSLPFKGVNNFWNRLANAAGWTLNYRTRLQIEQNDVLFEQSFDDALDSQDFGANTDWSVCSIKSYDSITDDEIVAVGNKYLDSAKKTKIVASFKKTLGVLPDSNSFAIVIWIERYEGGVAEITRFSSAYEDDGTSSFISIDSSNKVSLNKTSDVYTGTCYVNHEKIPANTTKMTIYARIYEVEASEFNVRISNDGKVRELLNGSLRQII